MRKVRWLMSMPSQSGITAFVTEKMMKEKTLRCLDLFCGAGGLSCGLHMAGIETVAGVDFDAAAINTFNANGIGKGVVADLEKLASNQIRKLCGGNVDLIVGGPPCQGFSLSGNRDENDKRNRLYKSFVRIVRDMKPEGFVLENVPGLVSLFGGKVRDRIISEFTELGYQVKYQIMRASDYGVPQHRRRVVFVGFLHKRFEFPVPTHYEHPNANQKKMVSCKEALEDLPSLSTMDSLGTEIQEYAHPASNDYQRLMRSKSEFVTNHIAARHSVFVRETIALVPAGKNYKSLPDNLRDSRNFHVAWTRFPIDEPSPTIDTGHRHHFHYKECRVPTVRECARLQSFPDDFRFLGNKTQQFRQVGNAVPPLMAKVIGQALTRAFFDVPSSK